MKKEKMREQTASSSDKIFLNPSDSPDFTALFREFGYIFVKDSETHKDFLLSIADSKNAYAVISARGNFAWLNSAWTDQMGFSLMELEEKPLSDIVAREYQPIVSMHLEQCRHSFAYATIRTADFPFVIRCRTGFGEIRSYECRFSAFLCDGEVMIIAQMTDLSSYQDLLAQFEQLEKHYNVLTETVGESIIRIDETFKIVFANSAVRQTFGYEKEELLGLNFQILLPPEIFERHRNEFRKYFIVDSEHRSELGLKRSMEVLGKHKSRGVSPMEMSFGNSSDFQGRTLTCIIRDITGRKNIERQLRKLAYHDRLTNLGNRDLFNTDMKEILGQLEKYPMLNGALMFLDLDGFKQINDTLGHNVGDELLLLTAGRLRECLRESDSIYRFGGDEFVVMLPKIDTKQDAITVARKILAAVRRPYYLHAKKSDDETSMVTIGVSIGIALFPGHGDNIQALIQNADLAMYESKSAGKNRYTVYDSSMVSKATLQLKIEQGLKNALNNSLFRLHYQPMVDRDGNFSGIEALLRWKDEELGEIPPSQFIPVAEEKGLIVPLGNWVLEKACRDVVELHRVLHFDFPVSINVSPIQWQEASFVASVVNIINRTGIKPDMVKLEITEQSLMENPDEVINKLTELKTKKPGLHIAVDDFGTGYSSLSYLSRLPADSLKIDISFTAHIDEPHNRKIVRTILTMAESLELEVVVEGIETRPQWDFFRKENCSILQGYFFSRPVPLDILKKSLVTGGAGMSFPV